MWCVAGHGQGLDERFDCCTHPKSFRMAARGRFDLCLSRLHLDYWRRISCLITCSLMLIDARLSQLCTPFGPHAINGRMTKMGMNLYKQWNGCMKLWRCWNSWKARRRIWWTNVRGHLIQVGSPLTLMDRLMLMIVIECYLSNKAP